MMNHKSSDIISYSDFTKYVNKVIDTCEFVITMSPTRPIGDGSTRNYCGRVEEICIGTNFKSNSSITYGDFTTELVALYHEIGHARQIKYEFEKQNDLSMVLAVNHFAQRCSASYYAVDDMEKGNYATHLTEIAAQYYGLNTAYRFLEENFDSESANTLICDYVNNEIATNFVPVNKHNPYTYANDIFEKYNDVFNDCIYKHRPFALCSKYIDTYSKFGTPKITAMLVAPTTSGLRQDIILTKLYLIKSDEGEHLRQIDFGKRIVKAVGRIDFDKVSTPFKGNQHVPAVQRVDLSTILPQVSHDKGKSDSDYGFR